jgi:hypothetical protein
LTGTERLKNSDESLMVDRSKAKEKIVSEARTKEPALCLLRCWNAIQNNESLREGTADL